MESFLEKTAHHLLTHYGDRLHQTTVVFPNKRAGLFLSSFLKQNIKSPIWMPKIYGIEEFMEELSGLQSSSNLQLIFHFYEAYLRIEKEQVDAFGDFVKWAQVLLHDFNEMDQQLVDPNAFFGYLHEVRQLETWNTDGSPPTLLQKRYIAFWKKSATYYWELKKRLLQEKEGYNGLLSRTAHEQLDDYISNHLKHHRLVFAGFNALTAAEEHIIQRLVQAKKAEVLWDADAFYLENEEQESGLFLRKHLKNWRKQKYNWITKAFTEEKKKIECIGVAQNVGQVKVAAQLLKRLKGDQNYTETALVLADEGLLHPMLQSLPCTLPAVNITMGQALKNAKITNLYQACIAVLTNASDQGFYHIDLFRFLNQTHFSLLLKYDEQQLFKTWEENVRKNNQVRLTKNDLPQTLQSNLALSSLFAVNTTTTLLEYLLFLTTSLKTQLGQIDQDAYRIEQEYLLSYYQLLNRLKGLQHQFSYIDSYKTLASLLTTLLSTEKIDFTGEPLSGLQVMGILETRNLHFKHLILLSVNEGTIPMGKSNTTFVPYDVRLKFKMPSHREKDAMFAYHFYRLVQKAEHVTLLYNTETDDFGSGEQSRFITQMKHELAPLPNINWSEQLLNMPVSSKISPALAIEKTPLLLEQLKQVLEKGLSPTGLSTYLNCPLDFYYRYLIGLRDEEEVEEIIEAGSLGSVIHEVLEASFQPYLDIPLEQNHFNDMLSKVKERVLASFTSRYPLNSLSYGKNLLAKEVVNKYVIDFLKQTQATHQQQGANAVVVKAVEEKLESSINIALPGHQLRLSLGGKIDRLDEQAGTIRIVDYKTGNVDPNELKVNEVSELFAGEKGFKGLQLMTYAYLYKQNHPKAQLSSGIFSFRKIKNGFMGLSIADSQLIQENAFQAFEDELVQTIQQLFSPQPFTHRRGSLYCKFCNA
jgi:ATP-dependent helicase/nuclease subunit B